MDFSLKGVCFDLDGVLVDTGEGHKVALNRALREVAGTNIPNDRNDHEFHARTTKYKLDVLAREGSIGWDDIPEIIHRKNKYTIECIESTVYPHPRITQLLEYIRAEYNIPLACVTNNQRAIAETALQMAEIDNLFSTVVTSDDVIKPKPDPESYLKVLDRLQLPADRVLAIEDNNIGINAAGLAGCVCWKMPFNSLSIKAFEAFLDDWTDVVTKAHYHG